MVHETFNHVQVTPGMLVENKETGEIFTVSVVHQHLGENNLELVDAKGKFVRGTAGNYVEHKAKAPGPVKK